MATISPATATSDDEEAVKIKFSECIDTVPIRVLGRSHLACVRCRTQKTKCDGNKPVCKTCAVANKECRYQFKDRKIILLESQINKLQDRIKYLESSLRKVTTNSSMKIIDSSNEELDRITQIKKESKERKLQDMYDAVDDDDDEDADADADADAVADDDSQVSSTKGKKKSNSSHHDSTDAESSSSMTSFLQQQYPIFPNPLFGNPEFFNKYFFNPRAEHRGAKQDKVLINPHGAPLLELSNKSKLKFDYALQNCLGDIAYFDSINPTVTNLHQNSKHYLSDNYFDYPSNGYVTLPEKEYALELFEIVYRRLCKTYYLFEREVFLQQIEKAYEDLSAQASSFLCKLLITLAIGEQLVFSKLSFDPSFSETYGERINSGIPGLKFFTLAIQLFRYNHEHFTLANIQTCLLMGYYEQLLNRTTSAFAFFGLAMKLSLANGYHRKVSVESLPADEREKTKRVWWSVYTMSAMCCARLHLPSEVSYVDTDLELPLANYRDWNDGFSPHHLQAQIMVARYVKEIVKEIYTTDSRNFDDQSTSKSYDEMVQYRLQKSLYFIEQFQKLKANGLSGFFERNEMLMNSHQLQSEQRQTDSRDDQNLLLNYHSLLIFAVRPVVLSYLRGVLKDSPETQKTTHVAIESSYEILKILSCLKNNFMLQTFDYWDNQYCFSALTILTVAGLSGLSSPLSSVGVEIMVFMANSGNHPARSYLAKLTTLDDCLTTSGRTPLYGVPLSSLLKYKPPSKNEESDPLTQENNKIVVKASQLSIEERKRPKKTKKPSKQGHSRNNASDKDSTVNISASGVQLPSQPPPPPPPLQQQQQAGISQEPQQLYGQSLAPQLIKEEPSESLNTEFQNYPEFFNDFVSDMPAWVGSYTDFPSTDAFSQMNAPSATAQQQHQQHQQQQAKLAASQQPAPQQGQTSIQVPILASTRFPGPTIPSGINMIPPGPAVPPQQSAQQADGSTLPPPPPPRQQQRQQQQQQSYLDQFDGFGS